jgi:probable rRNA maturation factor
MATRGHAISVHIQPTFSRQVRQRVLSALARRVLQAEGVPAPAALSIVVSDDETVRELNRRYRGLDTPTDVLSFRLDAEDGFVTPPDSARQLGEVIISCPTAARQALAAGHPTEEEMARLVVHGVLHVLGYDHESPDEAQAMRAKEQALLGGVSR